MNMAQLSGALQKYSGVETVLYNYCSVHQSKWIIIITLFDINGWVMTYSLYDCMHQTITSVL